MLKTSQVSGAQALGKILKLPWRVTNLLITWLICDERYHSLFPERNSVPLIIFCDRGNCRFQMNFTSPSLGDCHLATFEGADT